MIVVSHACQGHHEVGETLLQGNRGSCASAHGQIHDGACLRRMRQFLSKRLGDLVEKHKLQLRVAPTSDCALAYKIMVFPMREVQWSWCLHRRDLLVVRVVVVFPI